MGGKRRAVSTAEKRAELERLGERWPTYIDGTKQLWMADAKSRGGGHWLSFDGAKASRERGSRYRKENPEKVREGIRRYRENNPEKVREGNRKYRADNSEKVREGIRKWREGNPAAVRRAAREYGRRRLGWYDEGGMATSEESRAMNEYLRRST